MLYPCIIILMLCLSSVTTEIRPQLICETVFGCIFVPEFDNQQSNCSCWLHGLDTSICADSLVSLNMESQIAFGELITHPDTNFSPRLIDVMYFIIQNSKCDSLDGKTNTTVIESCPESMKNQDQKKLCEEGNKNLPPVDYPGPIYLTFKNIYCALCHGLSENMASSDLIPWSVSFKCEEDVIGTWKYMELMTEKGRCQRQYEPPVTKSKLCSIIFELVKTLKLNCRTCLLELNENLKNISDLNCELCRFAIDLAPKAYEKQCIRLSSPIVDVGFTVLFKLPTVSAVEIKINEKLFESSDICSDNENFDILFQKCREFECGFGQYAKLGECLENSTVYILSDTQPFPNGTSTLFMEIVKTTTLPSNNNGLFEDVVTMANSLTANWRFTKFPIVESPRRTSTRIEIVMNQTTSSVILDSLGHLKYNMNHVKFEFRISNFKNNTKLNISCILGEFMCSEKAKLFFMKEKILSKVESENKTFLYPVNNILFDLKILSPEGKISFNEICVCEPNNNRLDLNCPFPLYRYTSDEYSVDKGGGLGIKDHLVKFKDSEYYIEDSEAFVCYNPNRQTAFFSMDVVQQYVSWTCSGISIVCLFATILFYAIFSELCTLPAKLTIGLAWSLIFGQLLILFQNFGNQICKYIATATHFSWLSAFMWMSSQALQMLITFHPKSFQSSTTYRNKTTFRYYMITCLAVPLVIVGVCFILDSIPGDHLHVKYGVLSCSWMSDKFGYIFVFFVPVGMSLIFNAVCFCITLYYIEQTMAASEMAVGRNRDKQRCLMYVKLSTVMGFTWIFGFIASSLNVVALWYVYIILNGLQGLFIFLSFCCNQRNRRLMNTRMSQSRFSNTSTSSKTSHRNISVLSTKPN